MLPEDEVFETPPTNEDFVFNPSEFDTETEKVQSKQKSTSTLDEPVFKTLGRDAKRIAMKMYYVLLPIRWNFLKFIHKEADETQQTRILRDWDLWGPLIFVLVLDM